MNEITLETIRESPRLQVKEITKTALDLLGQPWFHPGFKSESVLVNRILAKEGDVWRLDFAADKNTLASFGFQVVKEGNEDGVPQDKVTEVRFRVGKRVGKESSPIISLTEQGLKKHQKVDDEEEELSEDDHRKALENWQTIKNCLTTVKQEASAKEKKRSRRRAGRLAVVSTAAALTAFSLPLFAPKTVAEAPGVGTKISQPAAPPVVGKKTEDLPHKVYFPLVEKAPSLYNKVEIESVDVYGLGPIKINNEDNLGDLLRHLDQKFRESGEQLNPDHRYLEYFVLQSVWEKFESEGRGELVRFVKRNIDYLNNMPVGDGVNLTGETLKDSGVQVNLRRIVVLNDEAFKDWDAWEAQAPEFFTPTADANARWTMKEDYRVISSGWDPETGIDYSLAHEGIHYWEGFLFHINFPVNNDLLNSFREITNPDGSSIPISVRKAVPVYEGGIMSAGHSPYGPYLEEFTFKAIKRMRELGLQSLLDRFRWCETSVFSEEMPQQNVLVLKDSDGRSMDQGKRVFFYATENRIDIIPGGVHSDRTSADIHRLKEEEAFRQLAERLGKKVTGVTGEIYVPVFAQSSEVVAQVGEDGEVIFPQHYLTETIEGWYTPHNKNFFLIVELSPGSYLYQHLTAMSFVRGFWDGHRESFEMEVKVRRP